MTVQELFEALHLCPADAQVLIDLPNIGTFTVASLKVHKDANSISLGI